MEILTKYIMYIPKNKKYLLYVLSIVMCSIVNARTIPEEEALQMIDRAGDAACYLIVAQADTLAVLTSTKWEY